VELALLHKRLHHAINSKNNINYWHITQITISILAHYRVSTLDFLIFKPYFSVLAKIL